VPSRTTRNAAQEFRLAHVSLLASLIDALYEQGKFDLALRVSEEAEAAAVPDDLEPQCRLEDHESQAAGPARRVICAFAANAGDNRRDGAVYPSSPRRL